MLKTVRSTACNTSGDNKPVGHDDVIKWKYFPRYWPFVRWIHRWPVNSPHKGQWRGALMFSLLCGWINGWVNNREAGDLRRHRAHYDVTVMLNDTFYLNTNVEWPLLFAVFEQNFINSLVPVRSGCNLELVILKLISKIDILKHFQWSWLHVNAERPHWWSGSGNGLVSLGNKSLPEPMFI